MNSIKLLEKLVSFDTVSSKSNLELVSWVTELLGKHGIEYRLTTNDEGTKQNIFASVGPRVSGGVILSGHTDVVPVVGQEWKSDPFTLTERDGRLYGRGTCDMKGFIASALAALIKASAQPLSKPLYLALSYDEEIGCLGVPRLIDDIADIIPRPRAVIIGEPTEMQPITQHKGSFRSKICLTGKAGHSSQPSLGVSAIHYAGKVLQGLSEYADELKASPYKDSALNPNYTVINTGLISGGTAPNVFAQNCEMTLATRFMPTETVGTHKLKFERIVSDVEKRMQNHAPECSAQVVIENNIPAFKPEENSEAVKICELLVGPRPSGAVGFGTEAGHFQEAGFSTVVFGPGSINQAHQANEFIEIEQMNAIDECLAKLIDLQM
ncbi:acetylornithine deacetylase [Reinekea marinisedimentorum]|uniref:Probable succinyl-diaminopimelate desuccinylase n=1 Tax=Reinekea marinisedimentorum TaxID=230495 RepID=A0A4R3HZJ2_9GAMM|nr:acetylornithine deacetylase [Reinekea marinisedimentorum]TCS38806.1 acetylornithine deacetylase [Reinekea marinisedimentorum]